MTINVAGGLTINPTGWLIEFAHQLNTNLPAYVDRELHPLQTSTPSYVNDITYFFRKLSLFDNLTDNIIIVTLDVTALYSSIPHSDGIRYWESYLSR